MPKQYIDQETSHLTNTFFRSKLDTLNHSFKYSPHVSVHSVCFQILCLNHAVRSYRLISTLSHCMPYKAVLSRELFGELGDSVCAVWQCLRQTSSHYMPLAGSHCDYTSKHWPSRVHSKAELCSKRNRSEQNCPKIRHTGCDIYIYIYIYMSFGFLKTSQP